MRACHEFLHASADLTLIPPLMSTLGGRPCVSMETRASQSGTGCSQVREKQSPFLSARSEAVKRPPNAVLSQNSAVGKLPSSSPRTLPPVVSVCLLTRSPDIDHLPESNHKHRSADVQLHLFFCPSLHYQQVSNWR